jgi:hypothetical protein
VQRCGPDTGLVLCKKVKKQSNERYGDRCQFTFRYKSFQFIFHCKFVMAPFLPIISVEKGISMKSDPIKLRELASWYRQLAERAGNPVIWEARLRTAEDLEREADRAVGKVDLKEAAD